MNGRQIAKSWEKFCATGSVQDYIAYRKTVSAGQEVVFADFEDRFTYADYSRWDRNQREEYR